jgi:GrpB-like predicted nucleotidyltransferase (UPF0157 family)
MGVGLDARRTRETASQGTRYRRRDRRRARLRDNHAAQCDDHAPTARPGMVDAVEERKIQAALGSAALVAETVGSTSIPGILAKPTIDILLAVRDSSDERAYVPALESPWRVTAITRSPPTAQQAVRNSAFLAFSPGSAGERRCQASQRRFREGPAVSGFAPKRWPQ